jgi:flagellar biosynthesis protein FliR
MPPVLIDAADVSKWVARLWWPVLRISGFVLTAPIASETTVPSLVKIALTLGLAFVLAPLAPVPADLSIFSGAGVLAAVQEVLIGIAIGMVVQLAFEALSFAGQSISTNMGLGFATLVDPQHGANAPVLGQLFMIFGMLAYLAVNGHLVLLGALAKSFQTLPIGGADIDRSFLLAVATWGARAAPQLNLFGIGFTITLLSGFFVLLVGLDGLMAGISTLIDSALTAVAGLVGAPAAAVH